MRSTAWKTSWILQVEGSCSRYVNGLRTSEILKGPSRFGAILLWYWVLTFRVSSQTCCPCLNPVNLFFRHSAILFQVSLCAANASSWSFWSYWSLSLTEGNLVFSKDVGIATGDDPSINSNAIRCWSECQWLLWVNSIVLMDLCQILGFDEQ